MENTILRMMYLHFEVWSDVYVQKKRQKNTETDINLSDKKRSVVDILLKIQDSDKMSQAKQEFKNQRYNLSRKPWQRPQQHPTENGRLSLVSMDRPDRPDLPPVISNIVQTIGTIMWKRYPDDHKRPRRLRRPRSLG